MSDTKPDVILTQRYADAVAYASSLHAEQARKSTNIPYISHLLGVSSLVLEAGGDEDMAIAGLLHDGPEDQGGKKILDHIRERFGDRVANIVEGCTDSLAENPEDKPPWQERKEAYIAHLKEADEDTLTVSLADKLHNARAIVSDLMITGPSTWKRFNEKTSPTAILWYYNEILKVGEERSGNTFLVTNVRDAVGEMERLTPPQVDANATEIRRYAMTFNAYERWFADLGTLSAMLEPLRDEFKERGQIPEGIGLDALRAWLFLLIRAEKFTGGLAPAGKGVFTMTDPPENPAIRRIVAALQDREDRGQH